ncbi:hypothetical protein BP5796_01551 [Coleophoma crateriformis]|uniref:Zn(2)-C6 fungal-type domain-containing protein n=1 Tax=Coleophoma crateriformis TaxID=565419 RepID=A0A3D8T0Q6_9HELO|nr:hypothetical protein BP5796_01551 [Coleophoma crateriformis]
MTGLEGQPGSPDAETKPDDREAVEDGEAKINRKRAKRTKTGCLTCRRRRIKCGEEKPTCSNCTKSKRQCEGYNQRVVFKDPLSAFRGPFAGTSSFSLTSEPQPAIPSQPYQQAATLSAPLPNIAPKPLSTLLPTASHTSVVSAVQNLPRTSPLLERNPYFIQEHAGQGGQVTQQSQEHELVHTFHVHRYGLPNIVDRSQVPNVQDKQRRSQPSHYDFEALQNVQHNERRQSVQDQTSPLQWASGPSRASISSSQELFIDSNSQYSASTIYHTTYPTSRNWPPTQTSTHGNLPSPPESAARSSFASESQPKSPVLEQKTYVSSSKQPQTLQYPQQYHESQSKDWNSLYQQIDNDDNDEDLYDVSDEDDVMEDEEAFTSNQIAVQGVHLKNNDLGIMVALQARQDVQEVALRSYTSFIDRANMLANYRPSASSSPLDDPMTARVFCHFINVTGPSISMFERHPTNPSLVFQGRPVPKSQQHIWSYTFPIMAMKSPALLHAMLAVASLHIARLQDGPITASLKHCAIALRRIARLVGVPSRRRQPATIAATLLLGFYECWCADHQKWSNHLLGAKQLVKEIDFVSMTRQVKELKQARRENEIIARYQAAAEDGTYSTYDYKRDQPVEDEVDENIIVEEEAPEMDGAKTYSEAELDMYETQQDLFWWYAKQDVYQSILGGGRLFLNYELWGHCPPRAPLGRLNASFGTYDHLMLLLARLADFAAKDLKRKKKVIAMNGGWRPPGAPIPPQSQANSTFQQRTPSTSSTMSGMSPGGPSQMAPFAGMMPGIYEAKLPMGFTGSSSGSSPQSTQSEDTDLEIQTAEAEEEWQDIRSAFTILEDNFGHDFQALGPEFSVSIPTPFGTALHYRTYVIAGIWMNYYMGLIACHRAHPSMPPAAMMAAGVAARQTAPFANEIGRIAAGIAPDCNSPTVTQVNPGIGAAIIESSMPLFIAGVQYQDSAQRAWTVERLRAISRLTGWQTSLAILQGCESSWIKVGELGRGPPYTRTKPQERSSKVFNQTRRLDTAIAEVSAGEGERRLVVARTDRPHYALGILGFDTDFARLDLDDDTPE